MLTAPPSPALSQVELAVRSRAAHAFTPPVAREVLAQQAADTNHEPMPILPSRELVTLPSNPSQLVPDARALVARGLDVVDDDEGPRPDGKGSVDLELLMRGGGPQPITTAVKREHALISTSAGLQGGTWGKEAKPRTH